MDQTSVTERRYGRFMSDYVTNYTALRVDRDDVEPSVAIVTIDHGSINLFDMDLYTQLARVGPQLAADDSVRAVVLQSDVPGWFIAHFDVTLIQRIDALSADPTLPTAFHDMCTAFATMAKPTIVALEGRAGGGGSELVMSCDIRVAAIDHAILNQPEVALGIIPGGSGTVRLPRLIGRGRAMEVILGCNDIDAVTAERWGWVNHALPLDQVRPYAYQLARRIASFPAHAVAAAKASVLAADGDLHDAFRNEAVLFHRTLAQPAAQAAMTAFMENGGQTPQGEARLGALVGELAKQSHGVGP